jgi:hypothetical protein
MTDLDVTMTTQANGTAPLPLLVTVTESFSSRLPSQRFLDVVRSLEPGQDFGEIAQEQPFRLTAFRALTRDYPDYDATALWLHAYDVEVDVVPDDPKAPTSRTPPPHSADIGDASPPT